MPRHSDFKTKLVALVLAGRSPEELADEFEPAGQTIRNGVGPVTRPVISVEIG